MKTTKTQQLSEIGIEQKPMTTTTVTQTQAQTTVKAKVVLENPNGTSHRLVVYNHEGWNPKTDLSLLDWTQALAGMSAAAKWAAGGISGSPKLLITAPLDKLGFANGTGRFAFVRSDFVPGQDDLVVQVDGVDVSLTVSPNDVPTVRGYRRLYLDGGTLYANPKEEPFTVQDKDTWNYWYCRTMSCLLEGANVSIKVASEDMIARAKAVVVVWESDDPAAANEQRRYGDRTQRRFFSGLRADKKAAEEENQGAVVTVSAEDLAVPLKSGGMINLQDWPSSRLIVLATESGITFRPQVLDKSELGLLTMAKKIRTENLKVSIHQ